LRGPFASSSDPAVPAWLRRQQAERFLRADWRAKRARQRREGGAP
jgi:hypothetical protein